MKRRITAKQIAKLANASQSAVSRAFLPNASISPQLKRRILKVAAEHGFRPNAMASSLITRQSRIVGLVMAYLDNLFYPYVLELLSKKLREEGYHVLLFLGDESGNADKLFNDIMQFQVDGIILASTVLSSNLSEQCMDYGIPVLMFNRFSENSEYASVVATDNFEGGRKVAHFLTGAGHQRISYLAGLEISSTNQERESGFLTGLKECGAKLYSRGISNYNFEQAKTACRAMFAGSASRRPDALFAANDHIGFAAMEVIRQEFGLRIPEDVSIVGYDNVPLAGMGAFNLTSVEQKYTEMVDVTVRTLLAQMGDRGVVPQKITISGDLVVRGSCRLPAGGGFKERNGRRTWSPENQSVNQAI